jgi:hypothetical protein
MLALHAQQHQLDQCADNQIDLFRQADHLDCLDCGALMVAKGVAITSPASHQPITLSLIPGSVTIFSPQRLLLRCHRPETFLQINEQREAALLFTAGLDWALEVSGILSSVSPTGATQSGWSDCALLDVQVRSVGYRGADEVRVLAALAPSPPTDFQGLPTFDQIARETRA